MSAAQQPGVALLDKIAAQRGFILPENTVLAGFGSAGGAIVAGGAILY